MSVQAVFHPSMLTQTNSPPISHTFVFCRSGTRGVTNRAAGSQSGLGVTPVVAWPTQVGEMKSLKVWPPSVLVYIVPSVYSPTILFAVFRIDDHVEAVAAGRLDHLAAVAAEP